MKIWISILLSMSFILVFAQKGKVPEGNKLEAAEKVLRIQVDQFKNDSLSFETRVKLIHEFIPRFVATLKEKNSFDYPFDSLQSIVKIYAPDSSFRIFTWQLKEPLGTHKYYGALQMNSEDLKLYPLFDYSDTMEVHPQGISSFDNWYGSVYYKCVQNYVNEKPYYTLFGYDEADFVSNRKIMEILSFNQEGKPVFGAPLISFTDSNKVTTVQNRFFIEYTDKASVKLNYDPEMKIIIYDHVVAPSESEEGAWFTYVPDGTYEGFEWLQNKWTWLEKIFHYSIGLPDSPPMPNPILDNRD